MSITISNCTFENCGTGIKAPSTAYMNLSNNNFINVGKCHDFYDDHISLEANAVDDKVNHFQKRSQDCSISLKKAKDQSERIKFSKAIRLLFNLEQQAKIERNQQDLKVIKRLKGLVGNKIFDDLFATLNR